MPASSRSIPPFAKEKDIDRDNGVYVAEVVEGSAAEEAGIEAGDVILSVDGVATLRSSELLEQLGRHRPGDEVELLVERDGRERNYNVTLKNSDGTTDVVLPTTGSDMVADLGADFRDLSEEMAQELEVEGVVISDLRNGLLSEQTRVQPGFILTRVNGRSVTSVEQLNELLEDATSPVTLEGVYPDDTSRTYKYAIVK